jgi:hypothetical protein
MDSKHIKNDWPINCGWNAPARKFVGTTLTNITKHEDRAALHASLNFGVTSQWSSFSIYKLILIADEK